MSQLSQSQILDFHNSGFPNRTYLTQWGRFDIQLQLVNAEADQERVIPSGQWRFRTEAKVTGVITPVGEGRGGVHFPAAAAFFQLWLLSTQGIYWKGEVKMCERSLQSHITVRGKISNSLHTLADRHANNNSLILS